ncbi:Gti1/Pac2 family-domain-containing protein, partial [Favolaschia claudopus]
PFATHPALHIRDITDAHRVLEAVRMKILPLIRKRLAAHERAQLRSGNVFVWEESENQDGLVRWTEGRRWSQSKMRGDCLFYEEKIGTTEEEKQAKAVRRVMKGSASSEPMPMAPKRKDRPAKVDGLIKQTYSVLVQMPGSARTKKWHLVAYYTPRDASHLPVVEDYEYLKDIRVPDGIFLGSSRSDSGTLGWFPTPVAIMPDLAARSPPPFSKSLSPILCGNRALQLFSPISRPARESDATIVLPPISPVASPTTLPPLASLGYFSS